MRDLSVEPIVVLYRGEVYPYPSREDVEDILKFLGISDSEVFFLSDYLASAPSFKKALNVVLTRYAAQMVDGGEVKIEGFTEGVCRAIALRYGGNVEEEE